MPRNGSTGNKKSGRPGSAAKGKTTMRDVAEHAGVSLMTVSRVFKEGTSVSYKTRMQVLEAAKELQFTPNVAARYLATSKSHTLGLLVHQDPQGYYFSDMLVGVMNKCREQGYNVVAENCGRNSSEIDAKILDKIQKGEFGGILLTEWVGTYRKLIRHIKKSNIPSVCIAGPPSDKSIPKVSIDDFQAAMEIVSYLIGLGHEDIGIIGGAKIAHCSHLRLEGYKAALLKHGIKVNKRYIKEGNFLIESGYRCARKLLSLKHPPTAIFAINDPMAAGTIQAAVESGYSVPRDLSVVGFDDVAPTEIVWPALTTINQSVGAQGEAAADLLIQLIDDPDIYKSKRLIRKIVDHKLVIRDSATAPRPANYNCN